jgi:hypothetical protein
MAKKEMHSEKGEMKADLAQDKKMVKKAIGMHDKQMHGGKKTNLTKLRAGGKTNSDMLKYGRNMAKIMNQRSSGRGG